MVYGYKIQLDSYITYLVNNLSLNKSSKVVGSRLISFPVFLVSRTVKVILLAHYLSYVYSPLAIKLKVQTFE